MTSDFLSSLEPLIQGTDTGEYIQQTRHIIRGTSISTFKAERLVKAYDSRACSKNIPLSPKNPEILFSTTREQNFNIDKVIKSYIWNTIT